MVRRDSFVVQKEIDLMFLRPKTSGAEVLMGLILWVFARRMLTCDDVVLEPTRLQLILRGFKVELPVCKFALA